MAICIPPLTITEAMLTSSTAAEPGVGEVAWSAATAWGIGDKAILGAPSATVTITIASPGVLTYTAHGFPAGTPVVLTTTGALPTGLTASRVYYVVNPTLNTFQLSATLGGAPIVTTGSQSGTHTAKAQIHRQYESQTGTRATVTMTIATPGVVTSVAHGLTTGTPIVFSTTGALPTGITAGTVYYALTVTTDTYTLAATVGGAAINTTGSQSGVHTANGNPNINHPPALDDGSHWLDVGPTNKWAMFDALRNTRTWQASPLTVVLTPGQGVNSLFLGNLVADSVTVTVTSGGSPVYTSTVDLSTRVVANWYDWFFAPFTTKPSVLLLDLPPFSGGVITVTITRVAGDVGCGILAIGNSVYLGQTEHGATARSKNFSKIDRSFDGTALLIPRRNVPTSTQTIWFKKTRTKALMDLFNLLNAVPAVWSGLDEDDQGYFEALLIFGICTDSSLNLAHPEDGLLTATFEEV